MQLVHLWVVSWNRQPIVRMENVERNATDEEQADKVLDAIDLAHRSRVPAALVESIAMQETDAESRVRGVSCRRLAGQTGWKFWCVRAWNDNWNDRPENSKAEANPQNHRDDCFIFFLWC